MGSWSTSPGLSHVGAYQTSGKPYASGSINCKIDEVPLTDCEVSFPYVTRWFKVINKDASNDCKVAFSISGLTGSNNFFTVGKADENADIPGLAANSGILELKVSSIYLSGSTNVDVVAGLTNILPDKTSTTQGKNWSGSSGVG
tara:strand:+ start:1345 stop:1776 length:432 start_codon:yes stop_codon:yes gene_type:complete